MTHWKYLKYVLRHKWYVLLACLKYGLMWQGITHDWSKFLPSEWIPYAKFFYGKHYYEKISDISGLHYSFGAKESDSKEYWQYRFDEAWNHHQKRQPHHWQYWLIVNPVAGKWYTASDKGDICQCLNSKSKTLNFVQSAALSVREKISFMADNIEGYAKSITFNPQGTTKTQTEIISTLTTGSATPATPKHTDSDKGIILHAQDVRLWSIMEEAHRLARVVVNLIMSFSPSTILRGAESNGEKNRQVGLEDSRPTDGQSTMDSRPYSAYFATIATRPTGTTGTVRINDTKILVEDSGKVTCLSCGLPFPKEHLAALPMPDHYRKEMIADWRGAGRAITGKDDTTNWYLKNRDKMNLHPNTRKWVERELGIEAQA